METTTAHTATTCRHCARWERIGFAWGVDGARSHPHTLDHALSAHVASYEAGFARGRREATAWMVA